MGNCSPSRCADPDSSSEDPLSLPNIPKNSYPLESDYEEKREPTVPSLQFKPFPLVSVLSLEECQEVLWDKGGTADHIYVSETRYMGSAREGKRHGYGSMQWSEAVHYTGKWEEGRPRGEGTMVFNGLMFRGLWADFQVTGSLEVVRAGLQDLAEWLQAYNEGYCEYYLVWLWYMQRLSPQSDLAILSENQLKKALKLKIKAISHLLEQGEKANSSHFTRANGYFGTTQDGKPHGLGKKSYAGGCFYAGEWRNGAFHGAGVYQWNPKKLRKAFFQHGQFDGLCILIENETETCSYFLDGKQVSPSALNSK